ncbi:MULTISPECIES: hypothetical protein [Streptomyces]|uniref:Uncharacterized protein n=1 Tax=Streptomyces bottropensis ATCC 25435 TaxID=1054862 RepID=M3EUB0_9ACTN|nr:MULTISPECIES: hypothetical protein [Streptomyces]EMF52703.1 hypothetical protein SBD_5779 [Streptomyces bottropensis ATCC 25435]
MSTAGNQYVPSGSVSLRTRAPVAANTKSLMSIASWRAVGSACGVGVFFCSSIEHHLRLGS